MCDVATSVFLFYKKLSAGAWDVLPIMLTGYCRLNSHQKHEKNT